jgi:WD40 repeat protein
MKLVSGCDDGRVKIYDVQSGQRLVSCVGHVGAVLRVTASHDGQRVASCGKDRTIRIWNADSGQEELKLEGHTRSVVGACFSADDSHIISASLDLRIFIWDAVRGSQINSIAAHTDNITGVCLSPDDKVIASCARDKMVKLWSREECRLLLALNTNFPVYSVCFRDDSMIAAGLGNGEVNLWDVHSGLLSIHFRASAYLIHRLCFHQNLVFTASLENIVKLWDYKSGMLVSSFKSEDTNVCSCVCLSADGTMVAKGNGNGDLTVWDVSLAVMVSSMNVRQIFKSGIEDICFVASLTILM